MKKKKQSGKPAQGRSPAYNLFVRIQPELGAALEAYIASLKPTPSAKAAVETCLEEFLTSRNFWPPRDNKGQT